MSVYSNEKEYDSAVKRIKKMEKHFVRALSAQAELKKAVVAYIKANEDVSALKEYYGSEQWKLDFSADEAGEFPAELKRGVLSEDGIWDLLEEHSEIAGTVAELAEIIE